MKNKFNWVFFDLDGTLADSIPTLYRIYTEFLAQFGIKGTKAEFSALNGPSMMEIVTFLKSKYKLTDSVSSLMELYKNRIMQSYKYYVKPVKGSKAVLEVLRNNGYKIMLVTSSNKEISFEFIKTQKWDKYFNDYVFGNEIKRSKPDPEIYWKAISKASVSLDAIVVVEDSLNGIISANHTGAKVIALGTNHSKEELIKSGASAVIKQLKDILIILEVKQ